MDYCVDVVFSRKLSFFLLSFLSVNAWSGVDETIKKIDQLISEGNKITILLIDMQTVYRHEMAYVEDELQSVVREQAELFIHYADNPNVAYVDVNMLGQGYTLPDLLTSLNLKKRYKYFLKSTSNSFETVNLAGPDELEGSIPGDLASFLHDTGTTFVMPTGCFESSCVKATIEGAQKAGFKVLVDRDLNIKVNQYAMRYHLDSESEYMRKINKEWENMIEHYPNVHVVSSTPDICLQ